MSPPPPEAGGWFWIDNQVVERIGDIGTLAASVYVVLVRYADDERRCFPSISTIARLCGTSKRAAWKAISRLLEAGIIAKETRHDSKGGQTSNLYRVLPLSPHDPSEQIAPGGVNKEHRGEVLSVHSPSEQRAPRTRPIEQDLLNKKGQTTTRRVNNTFRPPTLEEVVGYCRERHNQVDPQRFLDYYTSNGWRVGKNPMRDWKAAVRTWERSPFDGNGRPKADDRPVVYAN